MRRPLIVANWKMNGTVKSSNQLISDLIPSLENMPVDIVLCPPAVFLDQMAQRLAGSTIQLGGQTVNHHVSGAFTGELSVAMLEEMQCCYVVIGHSERRNLFGETDEQVAKKVAAVASSSMAPILCVGETLTQREMGVTEQVIALQIVEGVSRLAKHGVDKLVLAYEPFWAIGTGKTATPDQAQEVHQHIRRLLAEMFGESAANKTRILYGGSVNANNADALFAQPDIDGGLIGGASLVAEDFIKICHLASNT